MHCLKATTTVIATSMVNLTKFPCNDFIVLLHPSSICEECSWKNPTLFNFIFVPFHIVYVPLTQVFAIHTFDFNTLWANFSNNFVVLLSFKTILVSVNLKWIYPMEKNLLSDKFHITTFEWIPIQLYVDQIHTTIKFNKYYFVFLIHIYSKPSDQEKFFKISNNPTLRIL